MNSINLYNIRNEEISVSIEARFEGESLIIDGYDIGKKVKEYWGDSDYEYTTTIPGESVKKLFGLFGLELNDKASLLDALAARYNSNTCYSEIQKLLNDNKIPYEGFSWI